jgi:hypothetical protein
MARLLCCDLDIKGSLVGTFSGFGGVPRMSDVNIGPGDRKQTEGFIERLSQILQELDEAGEHLAAAHIDRALNALSVE